MLSDKVYESGENPQVGDKVTLIDDSASGWNSRTYAADKNKEYEVLKVVQGSKSMLITIQGNYGEVQMRANRFRLVSSVVARSTKRPPEFVVLSTSGKIATAAQNNEDVRAKLAELLLKNPSERYHVFNYVSTARTQKPKVEFVSFSDLESEVVQVNDGMFRKK